MKTKIKTLYEQDYYLWLEETANLLRNNQLTDLDIPNLLEEIEAMGRSEKRSLYSNLKVLLIHLLKYRYQPEKRSNSWRYTIEQHRQRITEAFEDSPSLRKYALKMFDKCYQDAKKLASKKTGLSVDAFPNNSPINLEKALQSEYLPE